MGKASAALAVLVAALLVTSAGSAQTRAVGAPAGKLYSVAFSGASLPANVDKLVTDAGGTIVVRIPQIGGIGVVSSSSDFATRMSSLASVADASLSAKTSLRERFDSKQVASSSTGRRARGGTGSDPQAEPDPLGSQQWDMMRMNVSSAGSYAINRGRPEVKVALTDTGVDIGHPDMSNLDLLSSRSFVSFGLTFPLVVPGDDTIQDFNGHGTWTAGAVGAPINAVGISGVAPRVSIVELKTQDAFGEGNLIDWDRAVVYAGDNHFDVLSSSVYTFVETCRSEGSRKHGCDDTDYLLAQRAVDYARQRGVTVLGATGNENLDVSDQRLVASPFGVPTATEVPAGLDGVIGVSATGYSDAKAFYSSYGRGVVDVAAPGGDSVTQPAPASYTGGGRALGAWSSTSIFTDPPDAPRYTTTQQVGGIPWPYAWLQGTSMATPDAAGVAALIVSRYGNFRSNSTIHMQPDDVARLLESSANAQACPDPRKVAYPFAPEPIWGLDTALCQGGPRDNGFFGSGIVDAVAALTRGGDR